MSRLGIGLGLNILRRFGSGLFPSDGLQGFYEVKESSFALTGDSVTQWDDSTPKQLGSEEVTNGDFSDNINGWSAYSSTSLTWEQGGYAKCTSVTITAMMTQGDLFSETSVPYSVEIKARSNSSVPLQCINDSNMIATGFSFDGSNQWQTFSFKIDNVTSSDFTVGNIGSVSSNEYIEFDSISVKKIESGYNNLTQTSSVNQPTYVSAENKISFGENSFMLGLSEQAGDFTYVIKGVSFDATSVKVLIRASIGGGDIRITNDGTARVLNNSGQIMLATTGTLFTGSSLILTKEGSNMAFYFDGIRVADTNSATGTFLMGKLGNQANSIQGRISDCVAVYNRALTLEEIEEISGIVKPIAKYEVDESNFSLVGSSVTQWDDSSGNGNHLIQNGTVNQPKYISAENKISFDTTDFLNGLPPQSGDFTYVVKGIDIPNYQDDAHVIFEVDYEIYGPTSARVINTYGSLRINDTSNAVVFLEPWSGSGDIAVTKESNTLKVYFNGVQLGSDVDVTGSSFDGIVNVSRRIFGLNGTISGQISVYNQALNADQIASI